MILQFLLLLAFFLFGFLGAIVLFGIALHYLERRNMRLIYRTFGTAGIVVSGFGTVIHELGHLVMCLIFRHKVIRVQLFRPIKFKQDGVLGQVDHAFSRKSFYQTMGCFFIGIGPIVFGIIVIALLLFALLPNVMFGLINNLKGTADVTAGEMFTVFLRAFVGFFTSLFSIKSLLSWQFWVFIIISSNIVLHMSLSNADLKGSKKGIASLIALILVLCLVLTLVRVNVGFSIVLGYNVFMLCFMAMGIVLSLFICGIMSLCYSAKERLSGKRKTVSYKVYSDKSK